MCLVDERIHGVAGDQRVENDHQVAHGGVVVLLGLAGAVGGPIADTQHRLVSLPVEADLDGFGDLPHLRERRRMSPPR